jgi:hypothetical protein
LNTPTSIDPPSCPYLIVALKHKKTEHTLALLATHLKAKSSLENEIIRRNQVIQLLDLMDRVQSMVSFDGCLFLGDLNADCMAVKGKSKSSEEPVIIAPDTVNFVMNWKQNYFQSAYPLPQNEGQLIHCFLILILHICHLNIDRSWSRALIIFHNLQISSSESVSSHHRLYLLQSPLSCSSKTLRNP